MINILGFHCLPHTLHSQINFFIILAVLRRSVLRVCKAHLRIIAPVGNTDPFEEMSQRWRAVGNAVSDLTTRDLNHRPPLQRRTCNRSTNWPVACILEGYNLTNYKKIENQNSYFPWYGTSLTICCRSMRTI